jgi:Zn-dependent protease/CBS domain-containing protein
VESTITLGRIRGIPIGVHWSVLGIFVLIVVGLGAGQLPDLAEGYSDVEYWVAAVVIGIVFFVSLTAHEVSHALVATREGLTVDGLTLWLLGGVARLRGRTASPGAEFRIAVVGPAVSLLIGVVAGAVALALDVADVSALLTATVAWLAGINVILAIFNMIPAAPLDGGRVLRSALWAWRKDRRWSGVVASRAGRGFGVALMALGALLFFTTGNGLWYVLLGWFLFNVAQAEEQQIVVEDALEGVRVRDVMTADPVTAPADLDVDRFLDEYVMRRRYATFPVVDDDGHPRGVLTLRRLRERPHAAGAEIGTLACPMDEVPTARPDEPLVSVLERIDDRCAEGRLLVVDDGRVVGIVSPSDVRRALDVHAARRTDPDGAGPGPR